MEHPKCFYLVNGQSRVSGLQTGAVHTELNLSAGETPGEGDEDPNSLEALIRRARKPESGG
jgi:hypothetical protein